MPARPKMRYDYILARTLIVSSHSILGSHILYPNVPNFFYMWKATYIIINDRIHYNQLEKTLVYRNLFFANGSAMMVETTV